MPPKKIGFAAKRSSKSSLSRGRQPQMRGYKEGVRIMDKSAKLTVGNFFGSIPQKRSSKSTISYSTYNPNLGYESNDNKSNTNWKSIFGIIFLTLFVIMIIIATVLLFQGSLFLSVIIFMASGFFLGPSLYCFGINM